MRHGWRDAARLRALRGQGPLTAGEWRGLIARLGEGPRADGRAGFVFTHAPAARLADWLCAHPAWREQVAAHAAGPLADTVTCLGRLCDLTEPEAWRRDPLRAKPWPRRHHARLRLDQPDRPGDVRGVWEPARFHHALLLARAYLATRDDAYVQAFLRQIDSFEHGNPPYRSIHWSVGMEVAIRAANLIFALEFFRGSPALDESRREQLVRLLLVHGAFIEHHIERHPLGFTTNHTLADFTGLAVLGRWLDGTACGARWHDMAAAGMQACLADQVLIGGAHAEGSLPYERFALEACLTAVGCLGEAGVARLRRPVMRMAAHLHAVQLGGELPFVGDGDDSCFPPFGLMPEGERDALDPEPALQVAALLFDEPGLNTRRSAHEVAYWLGAPLVNASGVAGATGATGAEDDAGARTGSRAGSRERSRGLAAGKRPDAEVSFWEHRGVGGARFHAGAFEGLLVSRGPGEGWLPTHGHNDLLSLSLAVNGSPVLIDPGMGGYANDRALRHRLRATGAHSTVQLDELEQSPIRERATFEGPHIVPGGLDLFREAPLRVCAWHGGFRARSAQARTVSTRSVSTRPRENGAELPRRSWEGASGGYQHTRRILFIRGQLCIEDVVFDPIFSGDHAPDLERAARNELHATTLRYRLAPGLRPQLETRDGAGRSLPTGHPQGDLWHAGSGPRRDRRWAACAVDVPGGTLWFLLLRPLGGLWQIESDVASRRYGEHIDAPVLVASLSAPLPHRWLTVVQFRPNP
jgi:hypothetical protein